MKEFEVWTEGYVVTGESSDAIFHGKIMAESFDGACIKVLGSSLDRDESKPDGYRRNSKGNMCVWACGCYDNEKEALELDLKMKFLGGDELRAGYYFWRLKDAKRYLRTLKYPKYREIITVEIGSK